MFLRKWLTFMTTQKNTGFQDKSESPEWVTELQNLRSETTTTEA